MYNPKCGKVPKLRFYCPAEMFTCPRKMPLQKKQPYLIFEDRLLFLLASTVGIQKMLHDSNLVEGSRVSKGLILFKIKKEPR